jgi:hypothetical protein
LVFYYSKINYKANNDSGLVIQKNVQLNNYPAFDALMAVQHGNGLDWWLIFQRWYTNLTPTDTFYIYQINPLGISGPVKQSIGSPHKTNLGHLVFSPDGTKFANVSIQGLIENLSVINQPDSLGLACDFQPFSFYLGGARTYYGLPNNPDYELGAWVGSPCDTLTVGQAENDEKNDVFFQAWYNPEWNMIHVNASKLKGKSGVLRLFDVEGRVVVRGKWSDIRWVFYN